MRMLASLCLAFAILFGLGCESSTHATNSSASAAVGAAAPAFSLEDQTGKAVSLADFAGKVVVLEWINPDCPFVQRHGQAKTMATLASKYADKGVVWIGVNSTHYMTKDHNQKWIASQGLPYVILDDQSGAVARAYGAKTTPHMFVIDPKGMLVYEGSIDDDPQGKGSSVNYVEKALDEVLAGKAVSTPRIKPYGCSVKFAK